MSQDNRIRMPSSGGGLVNYYEDSKSKLSLKPAHVMVLVIAVLFLLFILYQFGYQMLGISKP